jgi:hypothetical protein
VRGAARGQLAEDRISNCEFGIAGRSMGHRETRQAADTCQPEVRDQ